MLSSIEYKQNFQKTIGTYKVSEDSNNDEGFIHVNLLNQEVEIEKFCDTYLRIPISELKIMVPFKTQKRYQTLWTSQEEFLSILDYVVENQQKKFDNRILQLIKDQFHCILKDVRARILHLHKFESCEPSQNTSQEMQNNEYDDDIQQKLNRIRSLDNTVKRYNDSHDRQQGEKESLQILYILKTNVMNVVGGKIRQIIKIGMTKSLLIGERLSQLYGEYQQKIIYSVLFNQSFHSKETIDLKINTHLLKTCPQSKVFLIDNRPHKNSKGQKKNLRIKNELFYLTDEVIINLQAYIGEQLLGRAMILSIEIFMKTLNNVIFMENIMQDQDNQEQNEATILKIQYIQKIESQQQELKEKKSTKKINKKDLQDSKENQFSETETVLNSDNIFDESQSQSYDIKQESDQETLIFQQKITPTLNIFKRMIYRQLQLKQIEVVE